MKTSRKPDDSDKAKGRELAELRKAAGLSQEQLAIQLGISAKQLGKNERGQIRMPIGRYEAALNILRGRPRGGFSEEQASYHGQPAEDALRLSLRRLLKQCLEIVERL